MIVPKDVCVVNASKCLGMWIWTDMDDPRFKHVSSDPRFKAIPKRSRKVTIDSRFQSMFTDDSFKVKYKVDKRGRKVKQSSNEDLRKYYELKADAQEEGKKEEKSAVRSTKKESKRKVEVTGDLSSAESAVWSSDESGDDGSSSDEGSSDGQGLSPDQEALGAMEGWREEMENVPLSGVTSRRIALCNMDWDYLGARDIFVLLSSFKPSGSSVLSVIVYPSDFGLERMAREDVEGPVGPGGMASKSCDQEEQCSEGSEYSKEKLRQYQLSRFKYYYAVVTCDSVETAEHIYNQCNGLEYEHSGGQLDLRFIPHDVTFEDRDPKSTAIEDSMKADFTPINFVSSALQQSKVQLTWDETDPHRVQVTQRKFTKDDLQSMNFSAYLASSSDAEEGEKGEDGDKLHCYKMLLEEGAEEKVHDSVNEEMEITWEPGLAETVEKMVKKKKKKADKTETPWEKYLQEKKERRRQAKGKKKVPGGELQEQPQKDAGFDDPFFHHSITTATAGTTKHKKGKRKRGVGEEEQREKNELELLMMSDGEEEGGKEHFSLSSIMRSEKESSEKRKKAKKERAKDKTEDAHVENFEVDVSDPRFKALYESHLYAPDPSAPQYRATKGMAEIMEERQRRGKNRTTEKSSNKLKFLN